MTDRLLRIQEVMEATRRSRFSIYGDIKKGTFPAPINIGPRSVAWRASEVQKWIDDRAAAGWTKCGNNPLGRAAK